MKFDVTIPAPPALRGQIDKAKAEIDKTSDITKRLHAAHYSFIAERRGEGVAVPPGGDEILEAALEADKAASASKDAVNAIDYATGQTQVAQIDVPVAKIVAILGAVGTLATAIGSAAGPIIERFDDRTTTQVNAAAAERKFESDLIKTGLSYPTPEDRRTYIGLMNKLGFLPGTKDFDYEKLPVPSAPLPTPISTPSPSPSVKVP